MFTTAMISIAMATYNGAKYIKEQIDSILAQTIPDFELVVCDDCSIDDTFRLLEEYAQRDKRIKVYRNEKRLGFKDNFAKALSLCSYEFVAMSDQDDVWTKNHLEVLIDAMSGTTQVTCGEALMVDEKGNSLGFTHSHLYYMDCVPNDDVNMARHIILFRGSFQGASMLMRRSFVERALPIPDGITYHDSWISALACFSGGFKFIDDIVTFHRKHPSEVTCSHKRIMKLRVILGAMLREKSMCERNIYIKNIVDRIKLTENQIKLINKMEKIIQRRHSLFGRMANLPYLVRYARNIYTIDIKKLLQ